jgi:hypothetical protein
MKTLVLALVEGLLPRGIPKTYLQRLREYRGPMWRFLANAGSLLGCTYRAQVFDSFNKYVFTASMALIVYCYGWVAGSKAQALFVVAGMLALTLRDAWTYQDPTHPLQALPERRYYIDSAKDAAVVLLSVLASQALMLETSREIALPQTALCRATAIFLPLVAIVRMALRPKPDPKLPFRKMNLSAESLYRRTWFLNGVWIAVFSGVCAMSTSDVDNNPWDFLRGALIPSTYGVLFAIQRRTLLQRTFVVTIFTNVRKLVLGRNRKMLAYELKKGELGWQWYIAIHIVVFAQAVLALVGQLSPWLSGEDPGFTRSAVALIGFAATVLSWRYVMASNRAAARAIEEEMEREEEEPLLT